MKDELTAAMHSEFSISQESDNELRALSLLGRERDGIPITDEKLADYGFTVEQMDHYRKVWERLFVK